MLVWSHCKVPECLKRRKLRKKNFCNSYFDPFIHCHLEAQGRGVLQHIFPDNSRIPNHRPPFVWEKPKEIFAVVEGGSFYCNDWMGSIMLYFHFIFLFDKSKLKKLETALSISVPLCHKWLISFWFVLRLRFLGPISCHPGGLPNAWHAPCHTETQLFQPSCDVVGSFTHNTTCKIIFSCLQGPLASQSCQGSQITVVV